MQAQDTTAQYRISTHALREEGDQSVSGAARTFWNFYPRPPRGGRPRRFPCRLLRQRNFYPRPPRGGRLCGDDYASAPYMISTHALREEGDVVADIYEVDATVISTHALREEGDRRSSGRAQPGQISTHALREEGDKSWPRFNGYLKPFLPTPSARRATLILRFEKGIQIYFYPRPPRGGRQLIETGILAEAEFLPTPSARRATC